MFFGFKKSLWDSPRGSDMHLQWGPCVQGPGINHMERNKESSNSVTTDYSKDAFKEMGALLQSKNIRMKNFKSILRGPV
jgi:hypothetical protein